MTRTKNAITEHWIAPMPADETEPEWLRLSKWISSVGDDPEEESEDTAWYDGDGTPETDIISIKKSHPVEGLYSDSDPAHKLIRSLEFEVGEGRKIMYKQVRANGDELIAPATIADIVTTGGEASDYAPLTCTITWNRKPEITPATP